MSVESELKEIVPNVFVASPEIGTLQDLDRLTGELGIALDPTAATYASRKSALDLAFPQIKNREALAIDYQSAWFITQYRDQLRSHIGEADFSRVYEMFSGCGGDTCTFLPSSLCIRCHEPNLVRFCCLIKNVLAHINEGLCHSKLRIELFNSSVSLSRVVLRNFSPTVIYVDPPWGNYLESNTIAVMIQGKLREPHDIAKLCFMANPTVMQVYKLPNHESYTPKFAVAPINIMRTNKRKGSFIAFSIYVLRSIADLKPATNET